MCVSLFLYIYIYILFSFFFISSLAVCFRNRRRRSPCSPQIDCTENEAVCLSDPWKIDRYPTLYVSRKGKLTIYEGKPERKAIISHMREMNRPRPQVRDKGQ